jgi:hypothetical protein
MEMYAAVVCFAELVQNYRAYPQLYSTCDSNRVALNTELNHYQIYR